jgi:hypothetical protein
MNLTLNIISPSENKTPLNLTIGVPTQYNGFPIRNKWSDVGGKPKILLITNYMGYKLARCLKGYVLLCQQSGCYSLSNDGKLCSRHIKGEESYCHCRSEVYCTKRPGYGYENNKPLYCVTHKLNGMIDVKNRRCCYPNCTTQPHFGYKGEPPQYCSLHKLEGMFDLLHKHCEYPDCMIRASYGYEGYNPQYCVSHKLEDMINITDKRCEHQYCFTRPTFGYQGRSPQYCILHKLEDMIDLKHQKCEYENCTIRPYFGYKGECARYCNNHKLKDMINVMDKRCEYPNCMIRPSYGYKNENAKYCASHKLENMINVVSKRCEYPNCMLLSTFGYQREFPQYCFRHKLENMIDVKHNKCEYENCMIRSCFGYKGEYPRYCNNHKLKDMINVINRKCGHSDCIVTPSYSILYSKSRTHCREHSNLNQYSAQKSNPLCTVIDCNNIAYYIDPSDPNIYPIRCNIHRFPYDILLINRICPNCNNELYFPNNREVCMNCGLYRERTLYHFKEMMIKFFLQSNNIISIHDKPISLNGSKYRPDFLIQSKFGYIILEVDEHQHNQSGYNQQHEIERMQIIYNDIKLISEVSQVLFIRYNPDEYIGIQQDMHQRYKYLYLLLVYFIEIPTIGMNLGQIRLYYDNFTYLIN